MYIFVTYWHKCLTKTQICLRIRTDWSEFSLSAGRTFVSLTIQNAPGEEFDQTREFAGWSESSQGTHVRFLTLRLRIFFLWFSEQRSYMRATTQENEKISYPQHCCHRSCYIIDSFGDLYLSTACILDKNRYQRILCRFDPIVHSSTHYFTNLPSAIYDLVRYRKKAWTCLYIKLLYSRFANIAFHENLHVSVEVRLILKTF